MFFIDETEVLFDINLEINQNEVNDSLGLLVVENLHL